MFKVNKKIFVLISTLMSWVVEFKLIRYLTSYF